MEYRSLFETDTESLLNELGGLDNQSLSQQQQSSTMLNNGQMGLQQPQQQTMYNQQSIMPNYAGQYKTAQIPMQQQQAPQQQLMNQHPTNYMNPNQQSTSYYSQAPGAQMNIKPNYMVQSQTAPSQPPSMQGSASNLNGASNMPPNNYSIGKPIQGQQAPTQPSNISQFGMTNTSNNMVNNGAMISNPTNSSTPWSNNMSYSMNGSMNTGVMSNQYKPMVPQQQSQNQPQGPQSAQTANLMMSPMQQQQQQQQSQMYKMNQFTNSPKPSPSPSIQPMTNQPISSTAQTQPGMTNSIVNYNQYPQSNTNNPASVASTNNLGTGASSQMMNNQKPINSYPQTVVQSNQMSSSQYYNGQMNNTQTLPNQAQQQINKPVVGGGMMAPQHLQPTQQQQQYSPNQQPQQTQSMYNSSMQQMGANRPPPQHSTMMPPNQQYQPSPNKVQMSTHSTNLNVNVNSLPNSAGVQMSATSSTNGITQLSPNRPVQTQQQMNSANYYNQQYQTGPISQTVPQQPYQQSQPGAQSSSQQQQHQQQYYNPNYHQTIGTPNRMNYPPGMPMNNANGYPASSLDANDHIMKNTNQQMLNISPATSNTTPDSTPTTPTKRGKGKVKASPSAEDGETTKRGKRGPNKNKKNQEEQQQPIPPVTLSPSVYSSPSGPPITAHPSLPISSNTPQMPIQQAIVSNSPMQSATTNHINSSNMMMFDSNSALNRPVSTMYPPTSTTIPTYAQSPSSIPPSIAPQQQQHQPQIQPTSVQTQPISSTSMYHQPPSQIPNQIMSSTSVQPLHSNPQIAMQANQNQNIPSNIQPQSIISPSSHLQSTTPSQLPPQTFQQTPQTLVPNQTVPPQPYNSQFVKKSDDGFNRPISEQNIIINNTAQVPTMLGNGVSVGLNNQTYNSMPYSNNLSQISASFNPNANLNQDSFNVASKLMENQQQPLSIQPHLNTTNVEFTNGITVENKPHMMITTIDQNVAVNASPNDVQNKTSPKKSKKKQQSTENLSDSQSPGKKTRKIKPKKDSIDSLEQNGDESLTQASNQDAKNSDLPASTHANIEASIDDFMKQYKMKSKKGRKSKATNGDDQENNDERIKFEVGEDEEDDEDESNGDSDYDEKNDENTQTGDAFESNENVTKKKRKYTKRKTLDATQATENEESMLRLINDGDESMTQDTNDSASKKGFKARKDSQGIMPTRKRRSAIMKLMQKKTRKKRKKTSSGEEEVEDDDSDDFEVTCTKAAALSKAQRKEDEQATTGDDQQINDENAAKLLQANEKRRSTRAVKRQKYSDVDSKLKDEDLLMPVSDTEQSNQVEENNSNIVLTSNESFIVDKILGVRLAKIKTKRKKEKPPKEPKSKKKQEQATIADETVKGEEKIDDMMTSETVKLSNNESKSTEPVKEIVEDEKTVNETEIKEDVNIQESVGIKEEQTITETPMDVESPKKEELPKETSSEANEIKQTYNENGETVKQESLSSETVNLEPTKQDDLEKKVEEKVQIEKVQEDEEEEEEEEEEVSEYEEDGGEIEVEQFFVKYKSLSYLHCEWRSRDELFYSDKRIDQKIKRFKTKKQQTVNFYNDEWDGENENYNNDYDELFNPDYVEVDRILDYYEMPDPQKPGEFLKYYLVKWKALAYDESTWELEHDIKNIKKIERFRQVNIFNPELHLKIVPKPKADKWQQLKESRTYKNGNKLREYQIEGISWLSFCWINGRNCILADEMGLGKTIQSITFVQEMAFYGVRGPFLILVPLSTIGNWIREFETWTDFNVIVYHGSTLSRQMIQDYEFYFKESDAGNRKNVVKFNALITTYEVLLSDVPLFCSFKWRSVIIDEAHRLKNKNCKLIEGLRFMDIEHKVLLTGTPLQNNVEELFSLLNFLEPQQFNSSLDFMQEFGDLKTDTQVAKLQAVLKPMMLRRLKEDVEKNLAPKEETIVEVELTNTQKKYYRAILEKNFQFLTRGTVGSNMPNLMNTMMELRKCCNHPYLINGKYLFYLLSFFFNFYL
jgi:chromodomain-helicase-DNA-binding protein 7